MDFLKLLNCKNAFEIGPGYTVFHDVKVGISKGKLLLGRVFHLQQCSYISQSIPSRIQLLHNPPIQWNEWNEISDLKENFVARRDNSFLHDGFQYNIKTFFSRKPCVAALNWTEAILLQVLWGLRVWISISCVRF